MADNERAADLIRRLRADAGMTLEQLAEAAGVSVRGISDIERGVTVAPRAATLRALAGGLGLDEAATANLVHSSSSALQPPADLLEGIRPPRLADFVGRDEEVAQLEAALARPGAVAVITGPAGFGKTSLAIETAARLSPDSDTAFVEASKAGRDPLTPLEVIRSILMQIDDDIVEPQQHLAAAIARWSLIAAAKRPVVILDNVATEDQVRPVLTAAERGAILVTSRRTIAGLEATTRLSLDSLQHRSSVEFLERVIPAAQRTREQISELAAICNGVPLALRIAANRIASRPATTAGDYVARMQSEERRLALLVAGDLSVEAAFAPSYADLGASQAALFRSLALIDSTAFDATTAAVAAGISVSEAEDGLETLVDLSLVESRSGSRYRLHDLVRLIAASRLQLDDPAVVEGARERLTYWLLACALEVANAWMSPTGRTPIPEHWKVPGASITVLTPGQEFSRNWVIVEAANWRPALRRVADSGDHESVDLVVGGLQPVSQATAEWDGWHDLNELGLRSARALGDPRIIARHSAFLSWTWMLERGDPVAGFAAAEESLRLAESVGDEALISTARVATAWICLATGQVQAGLEHVEAAFAGLSGPEHYGALLQARALEASLRRALGDFESSAQASSEILEVTTYTPSGDDEWEINVTRALALEENARANIALGRLDRAEPSLDALFRIGESHRMDLPIARARSLRAALRMAQGDRDAAEIEVAAVRAITGKYPGNPHAEMIAAEVEGLLNRQPPSR
ncbi:helix-turn-helix domain-containing protein [Microbacterium sp. P05]|uniref:helix-turn-helix domain-containing protein n=1 Tax=Microbacterium sp. P05 TaxID=3366948 RepID=UPI0037476C76